MAVILGSRTDIHSRVCCRCLAGIGLPGPQWPVRLLKLRASGDQRDGVPAGDAPEVCGVRARVSALPVDLATRVADRLAGATARAGRVNGAAERDAG